MTIKLVFDCALFITHTDWVILQQLNFIDFLTFNINLKNNFNQDFTLINCVLIDNEFDEPPYHLKWVDGKLVWTWKYIRMVDGKYVVGTEEWLTPVDDWECWCWRKQKWKLIIKNWKALPGMLEAINPENKICIVRANRFNSQNHMSCWNPEEKYWSIGPTFLNVDEYDDTIKIWCKVPCAGKTWHWLYYPILDEEDKILLHWSHALKEWE